MKNIPLPISETEKVIAKNLEKNLNCKITIVPDEMAIYNNRKDGKYIIVIEYSDTIVKSLKSKKVENDITKISHDLQKVMSSKMNYDSIYLRLDIINYKNNFKSKSYKEIKITAK